MTFSIATNCCVGDEVRICRTIPSWLRVFGAGLEEVLVVVDERPATGRIATLQGPLNSSLDKVYDELEKLQSQDIRIRYVSFPSSSSELKTIAKKWFNKGIPLRCQAGTPILAFIYGIENSSTEMVLRTDCDMLFCDQGWVDNSIKLLQSGASDLIEPPHLGQIDGCKIADVSSRAFFLHSKDFSSRLLPMKAHCLDPLRRFHRYLHRRSPWLALEQMFQLEKRAGRLRHIVLDENSGFSMHIPTRNDASSPKFERVVVSVESAAIPWSQKVNGWNFTKEAWN